jgi:hypothetical protein
VGQADGLHQVGDADTVDAGAAQQLGGAGDDAGVGFFLAAVGITPDGFLPNMTIVILAGAGAGGYIGKGEGAVGVR